MSCINTIWHCMDHFLVMYDTQSGITIGDALSHHTPMVKINKGRILTYKELIRTLHWRCPIIQNFTFSAYNYFFNFSL
jgi:hypothetical protein